MEHRRGFYFKSVAQPETRVLKPGVGNNVVASFGRYAKSADGV